MKEAYDIPTLRTLIREAQAGNSKAFDEIYQAFLTPIYRYVYYRVKRKEDAEDISQTVFLKAYQSLHRFEHTQSSPLAYFYSIARNAVIDHWRKKGELFLDDIGDDGFDIPDHSAGERRTLEKIWAEELTREGIGNLTLLEAEAVTLRFLHDFSNAHIAEVLGKSEEAIRQLQSRGLRKMKRRMNPDTYII